MAQTCSITHCRCFPLELQPLSRPPGSEGDILHSYSTAARASYSRAGWISLQCRPRSCLLFNDLFWVQPGLKTENDRDSNLASCLLAAFRAAGSDRAYDGRKCCLDRQLSRFETRLIMLKLQGSRNGLYSLTGSRLALAVSHMESQGENTFTHTQIHNI